MAGFKPNQLEQVANTNAPLRRSFHFLVCDERLAHNVFDTLAGIKRTHRILKYHLHLSTVGSSVLLTTAGNVTTVKLDRSLSGWNQTHDRPSHR